MFESQLLWVCCGVGGVILPRQNRTGQGIQGELPFQMNLLDTGIVLEMLKRRQFKPKVITPIIVIEILRDLKKKKDPV